ncbi:hypothetical protein T10_7843 [Trichinella papuae]|uniref:Uncharacterized protein n=1 Tax=Trichinella papuae TaxID=268474 RepID=A0A0V1LX62_9BILA|nr:hypothetical protein T10_7843 [Trichinella papuae]
MVHQAPGFAPGFMSKTAFHLFCKNVMACWLCLVVHQAPGFV